MGKTSRNKKSPSENMIELLRRIKEKGYLDDFERDLTRRKGVAGFKKIYNLFKDFIEQDLPLDDIPSDKEWGKQIKQTEIQFNTARRDFYNRVVDFAGRFINKQPAWYKQAIVILSEVDALWELGLRDHAEIRFIELYRIYPKDENFNHKPEYSYVLSKMFYYGGYFFISRSLLEMEAVHQEFFQKSQFLFIKELESVAGRMDIRKPIYAEPEKWKINHPVFKFLNVLAMLAKQKGEFAEARKILKEQQEIYEDIAQDFIVQGIHGARPQEFFTTLEPQNADEIETAFYYYFKLEEFRLTILDGNPFEAQNILHELYGKLNESFAKSRSNLSAIILFLRMELEQSEYLLSVSRRDLESKGRDIFGFYFATKDEVDLLPERLEINRLRYEFFTSPEITKYETFKSEIIELEGRLKGVSAIKLDLSLLKLLVCFENQRYDDINEIIRSIKFAATNSGRSTGFLNKFLSKFSKINFSDFRGFNKNLTDLLAEIEPDRNPKNHLDNFIAFWLRQFGSRNKNIGL